MLIRISIYTIRKGKFMKYYINEEKRTVTAVMEVNEDAIFDYLDKKWNINLYFSKESKELKALYMPTKFVGVARCVEEDVFDPNIGKRIAREKALNKYYKSFRKRILRAYQYFTGLMIEDISKNFQE